MEILLNLAVRQSAKPRFAKLRSEQDTYVGLLRHRLVLSAGYVSLGALLCWFLVDLRSLGGFGSLCSFQCCNRPVYCAADAVKGRPLRKKLPPSGLARLFGSFMLLLWIAMTGTRLSWWSGFEICVH